MQKYTGEILISGTIMLLLDMCYITINKKMFDDQIIEVQRVILQARYTPAILCYILLILGLYYFIIRKQESILDAFLFGIVIYGVYETTNYTIFKKWNPVTVIVDTLWGGILMSTTTWFTYRLMN